MKKKELLQNLAILLISLLLVFLLLEGMVRIASPRTLALFEPDPVVGQIHVPNKQRTISGIEYTHKIKINSHGFNDREYPYEKPAGTFRIIVLGDSFTEGFQVPLEETFHEVLEKKLNQGGDGNYEVISLGMSAFGTGQEYLMLKNYGLRYEPDLVIVLMNEGDVETNSNKLHKYPHIPYFSLENGELVLNPFEPFERSALRKFLGENSQLAHFVFERIKRATLTESTSIPYTAYTYSDYDSKWDEAWEITKLLIIAIDEESKSNDAGFLLVKIVNRVQLNPSEFEEGLKKYSDTEGFNWDLEKPEKILRNFTKENSILYLELLPGFKEKYTKPTDFHYTYDAHWNKQGHALAAELIYEKLVAEDLI